MIRKVLLGAASALALLACSPAAEAGGYYQGSTSGGSSGPALSYLSGQHYQLRYTRSNANAAPAGSGGAGCIAGQAVASGSTTSLDFRITVVSSGGKVDHAIYTNGADNKPATYLTGFINYATDTAGTFAITVPSATFTQNAYYWLCTVADNNTATYAAANNSVVELLGSPTNSNFASIGNGFTGWGYTSVTAASITSAGAWPATLTGVSATERTGNTAVSGFTAQ